VAGPETRCSRVRCTSDGRWSDTVKTRAIQEQFTR
jgi:hypothetical protein